MYLTIHMNIVLNVLKNLNQTICMNKQTGTFCAHIYKQCLHKGKSHFHPVTCSHSNSTASCEQNTLYRLSIFSHHKSGSSSGGMHQHLWSCSRINFAVHWFKCQSIIVLITNLDTHTQTKRTLLVALHDSQTISSCLSGQFIARISCDSDL